MSLCCRRETFVLGTIGIRFFRAENQIDLVPIGFPLSRLVENPLDSIGSPLLVNRSAIVVEVSQIVLLKIVLLEIIFHESHEKLTRNSRIRPSADKILSRSGLTLDYTSTHIFLRRQYTVDTIETISVYLGVVEISNPARSDWR